MAAIITRQTAATGATVKGSPLSNAEVDQNFINLNEELVGKLDEASNLSDLPDKAVARTNLQVDSSTKVTAKAVAMAIALG